MIHTTPWSKLCRHLSVGYPVPVIIIILEVRNTVIVIIRVVDVIPEYDPYLVKHLVGIELDNDIEDINSHENDPLG